MKHIKQYILDLINLKLSTYKINLLIREQQLKEKRKNVKVISLMNNSSIPSTEKEIEKWKDDRWQEFTKQFVKEPAKPDPTIVANKIIQSMKQCPDHWKISKHTADYLPQPYIKIWISNGEKYISFYSLNCGEGKSFFSKKDKIRIWNAVQPLRMRYNSRIYCELSDKINIESEDHNLI